MFYFHNGPRQAVPLTRDADKKRMLVRVTLGVFNKAISNAPRVAALFV